MFKITIKLINYIIRIHNPEVPGSNPGLATTRFHDIIMEPFFMSHVFPSLLLKFYTSLYIKASETITGILSTPAFYAFITGLSRMDVMLNRLKR